MRLLLDEHFSPLIAEALRERGHDAVAVAEAPTLRGESDEQLLSHARAEGRALLTNDIGDFVEVVVRWAAAGRSHHGVLLTSDRSVPRRRHAIGSLIGSLEALMEEHPAVDKLEDRVLWISGASNR